VGTLSGPDVCQERLLELAHFGEVTEAL
jgi:hypothetical protein